MEKTKLQKNLVPIGLLLISAGLILKFIVDIYDNKLEFFVGVMIGMGLTLIVVGFIKNKEQKPA